MGLFLLKTQHQKEHQKCDHVEEMAENDLELSASENSASVEQSLPRCKYQRTTLFKC